MILTSGLCSNCIHAKLVWTCDAAEPSWCWGSQSFHNKTGPGSLFNNVIMYWTTTWSSGVSLPLSPLRGTVRGQRPPKDVSPGASSSAELRVLDKMPATPALRSGKQRSPWHEPSAARGSCLFKRLVANPSRFGAKWRCWCWRWPSPAPGHVWVTCRRATYGNVEAAGATETTLFAWNGTERVCLSSC